MIKVRNKVENNLQDLKSKEFDWLQHYFGLKRRIPKENKVLKEAERKVGEMIHKLKDDRTDIRLKVHKYKVLNGDISHGSSKSKDVSFRSKEPLKTYLEGGEKFIFTNTPVNNGNTYDNITGVFIAPVTGTYYFVLQLCLGGNYVDLSIRKGENLYSWARFFPYYLSCQTVDMLTPLQKGDEVYASKTSSWDYDIMHVGNDLYNTFSGVLIA
ncbi:uncharacterized protein LOC132758412 [Ruditapes philippinarum]|uniref:uncharacterized protein LOC132758412 n=1 Tax=Ruditapes philippinarum TaxID=129788 RepID=UPI00295B2393|nr:uncharacterized protein LOC132758412 [Ruditapes philippinarum]